VPAVSLRKIWILLIPTLALCFAIGFSIGAYPQYLRKILGKKSDTVLLLTSDARLVPTQFLLDYEKTTGRSIQVTQVESYHLFRTEARDADLLFAPLSWLSQFPEILKPLPNQGSFKELLSSDFLTLKLDLDFFLPLLWKTEEREDQTQLLIWGFATPQEDTEGLKEFLNFLLTSDARLQEWASQAQGFAFTLQRSNFISDFPENQKAQHFRNVSLPALKIDQGVRD